MTTIDEFIADIEDERIKRNDGMYNAYSNYEGKYTRKAIVPAIEAQIIEDSYFLY